MAVASSAGALRPRWPSSGWQAICGRAFSAEEVSCGRQTYTSNQLVRERSPLAESRSGVRGSGEVTIGLRLDLSKPRARRIQSLNGVSKLRRAR